MSNTTLILGPIVFQDYEIPCGINFGGLQRLAIHTLPGGVRVIDSLGREDADICFAGIFSGDNATLRARVLDEMRAFGTLLPLTWDVFFYTVFIKQFQAQYTNTNWIPYKITCTVLRDEASALIATALSLGASVLNDVASSVSQASAAGLDISSAQTALAAPTATVRDTATYGAAQYSLEGAQSSLSSAIGSAQASLPMTTITSPGPAAAGVAGLNDAISSSQQLSALVIARAYAGRAAINLANAST